MPLTPIAEKEFVAIFHQTGTSNPVLTILKNTLDPTIAITRQTTGTYRLTSNNAFPRAKTVLPYGDFDGDASILLPISDWGGTITGWLSIAPEGLSESTIDIVVMNPDMATNADWSTLATTSGFPIKIKVYN